MKMVKSLILGSAAGLLAMGGAQAADLPVKAKAVEYVKICSLYGAGFWYIPGTDTCIKLGGYLRVDANYNATIYDGPFWSGDDAQGGMTGNRLTNKINSRSRMALTVDTRTATQYGVVRTFAQADFQFSTYGTTASINPASLFAAAAGGTLNNDTVGNGYVAVEFVFLQFAGFTFGKSASAYATPWHGYPGNNSSFLLGGHDTVTGVNNVQYTAQFGNGVSGTIGLDEGLVFNRTNLFNLSTGLNAVGVGANAYGGQVAPDVVGNIRIDQAWGLFQISAAAHEVNASYNVLNTVAAPAGALGLIGGSPTGVSEVSGHPASKWGGSVMAALQIKNIPTGAGDDIKMDASWAKGDTKNVISTSNASPSFSMFSGTGRAGAYQSIGFGPTTDGMFLPTLFGGDGLIKLTTSYGFRGAFNHNWDPYWSSSLFGAYASVRNDSTAKAFFCAIYTAGKVVSADYSCNPDYNVSELGFVTRWTPLQNLTFSAETIWAHLDQKFTGAALLAPSAPKPATIYEFKDQNTFTLNVRVQRNF